MAARVPPWRRKVRARALKAVEEFVEELAPKNLGVQHDEDGEPREVWWATPDTGRDGLAKVRRQWAAETRVIERLIEEDNYWSPSPEALAWNLAERATVKALLEEVQHRMQAISNGGPH